MSEQIIVEKLKDTGQKWEWSESSEANTVLTGQFGDMPIFAVIRESEPLDERLAETRYELEISYMAKGHGMVKRIADVEVAKSQDEVWDCIEGMFKEENHIAEIREYVEASMEIQSERIKEGEMVDIRGEAIEKLQQELYKSEFYDRDFTEHDKMKVTSK